MPDKDFLLSLFPESEMASLAAKLGDGMEERLSAFLRRRLAEGILLDEERERESAVAAFLGSPF